MNRFSLIVIVLALIVGVALGLYAATSFIDTATVPTPQVMALTVADQEDYILNVADAFVVDGNLKLAQDRLARLRDPQIATRVENFASNYYSANKNKSATHLIQLAIALGSKNGGLISVVTTVTPTPLPTLTRENAPLFSNVRATQVPPPTATPTSKATQPPVYVVVTNENPFVVLPTNTPTITNTRRPNTRVPTPTITPTFTPVPPPPAPFFEPDRSRWPGTVYYEPANVEPGQGYWHLAHAIYCDAFDSSDDRKYDFGCEEGPGGGAGTSIYVMSGGNVIDVWAGGENVTDDPTIVGDKKNPGDMCQCDYSFEATNVKINVRGAPSDAIGGFCLCGVNFGWGSRAHVRYFLYFEYRIR